MWACRHDFNYPTTSYLTLAPQGQGRAWHGHHKKLCKRLPTFLASQAFQAAPEPTQMESLLLSRLIAQHFASPEFKPTPSSQDNGPEVDALLSLIPHPSPPPVPPVPSAVKTMCTSYDYDIVSYLSARSMNNHWVIHSPYLNPVANGVFPQASRSLNHSCTPTAVQAYNFDATGPVMEVRALKDMVAGEEVCPR